MGTWFTERTSLVEKSRSPLGTSPLVRESLRSAVRPAAYQTLSVIMGAVLQEGVNMLQEKTRKTIPLQGSSCLYTLVQDASVQHKHTRCFERWTVHDDVKTS